HCAGTFGLQIAQRKGRELVMLVDAVRLSDLVQRQNCLRSSTVGPDEDFAVGLMSADGIGPAENRFVVQNQFAVGFGDEAKIIFGGGLAGVFLKGFGLGGGFRVVGDGDRGGGEDRERQCWRQDEGY